MTVETKNKPPTTSPRPTDRDATLRAIVALADNAPSADALLLDAARLIAEFFNGPAAAAATRFGASEAEQLWTHDQNDDAWRKYLRVAMDRAGTNAAPVGTLHSTNSSRLAIAAAPLPWRGGGAIAVLTRCEDKPELIQLLEQLRAVAAALASACTANQARPATDGDAQTLLGALQRAGTYERMDAFAFALTNNLRNRLGAESVTLGLPRDGKIRISAISGFDTVKPRGRTGGSMRQALEECLDQGRLLCAQPDDTWRDERASTGHTLHTAWSESAGGASVASVPLFADDMLVAVVGIQHAKDRRFSREDLASIESMLTPFGVAIPMIERSTRPLSKHATSAAASIARRTFSRKGMAGRIAALASTVALAWFLFGKIPFQVHARASVEAPRRVQISSPFESRVTGVLVSAGDRVRKGDTLVQLDTTELELERSELNADIDAHNAEISRALAERDVPAAGLTAARLRAAEARLATVQSRLAAATVTAPADGLVLACDLDERLGQRLPIGEPLLVLAPGDGATLEIRCPEHAVDDVLDATTGRFSPESHPGMAVPVTVERIEPSAQVIEGQNTVIVQARLETGELPDWLMPGMEGVAKIDAGDRRVWWVALHRVIDELTVRFMP